MSEYETFMVEVQSRIIERKFDFQYLRDNKNIKSIVLKIKSANIEELNDLYKSLDENTLQELAKLVGMLMPIKENDTSHEIDVVTNKLNQQIEEQTVEIKRLINKNKECEIRICSQEKKIDDLIQQTGVLRKQIKNEHQKYENKLEAINLYIKEIEKYIELIKRNC